MSQIATQRLGSSSEDITRAAGILRDGGLVALPTETVYGLGADAGNDRAVARIYQAKGRPSFNPLIIHLADLEAVKRFVIWSDAAQKVADAFWPGPLTMVLPLRPGAPVSKLVTAGMDTIAVRMPASPVARELLRAFGGPVAAPSANRSGRISPTRAEHVLETLDGRIEAVLDAGRCDVGLESTIIGLAPKPTLLRPGRIGTEALAKALGQPVPERKNHEKISAPGQLSSHYAPNARVRLNAAEWLPGEARLGFKAAPGDCDLDLSPSGDLVEAAANLFEYLHRLDTGADAIAVMPVPHVGLGVAINDRLSRAAAPRD